MQSMQFVTVTTLLERSVTHLSKKTKASNQNTTMELLFLECYFICIFYRDAFYHFWYATS